MRIAISGMGLRSASVLSRFKEQWDAVEFVGFYDPQPTYLDDLDPDIPQFESVVGMLDETKPDLFFIGSPNEFHLEDLKAGFAAGVRMFCEKPIVTTIDDTLELAALLAKHGLDQVIVGLVLRYSRHMVDLRKAIDAGQLGDITSMEASDISLLTTVRSSCVIGGARHRARVGSCLRNVATIWTFTT
jgi:predicted dehydrogenase